MAHGLSITLRAITTKEQQMLDKFRDAEQAKRGYAIGGTRTGFYDLARFPKRSQAKLRRIERQTGRR